MMSWLLICRIMEDFFDNPIPVLSLSFSYKDIKKLKLTKAFIKRVPRRLKMRMRKIARILRTTKPFIKPVTQ